MFVFLVTLSNFRTISIFLAFSGSFAVKNDNIHSFFFAVLVAHFEFAGFAPKQKYTGLKWSVLQYPYRERTNQGTGICVRLALPYDKKSNLQKNYGKF